MKVAHARGRRTEGAPVTRVRQIAKLVRTAAEKHCADLGFRADLYMACAVVSVGLHDALARAGIRSEVVGGVHRCMTHAWVETDDGWLVDLTATQFRGPRVRVVRVPARSYQPLFRGTKAVVDAAKEILERRGIDPCVLRATDWATRAVAEPSR